MEATTAQPLTVDPATHGECSTLGCAEAADVEVSRQTGRSRWTVYLTCLDHASPQVMDAVVAASDPWA